MTFPEVFFILYFKFLTLVLNVILFKDSSYLPMPSVYFTYFYFKENFIFLGFLTTFFFPTSHQSSILIILINLIIWSILFCILYFFQILTKIRWQYFQIVFLNRIRISCTHNWYQVVASLLKLINLTVYNSCTHIEF